MVIEVVAALICQQGQVLACQRREDAPFALRWEFPGGKVEQGEGHTAALERELKEELGIEVCSASELLRHRHGYPGGPEVELRFYRVDDYRGTVINRAFQQILWLEIYRLREFDFLEGDLPLIEKLMRRELVI